MYNEDNFFDFKYTQYENLIKEAVEEQAKPGLEDISLYDLTFDDYFPYISQNANELSLTIEDAYHDVVVEVDNIKQAHLDNFAEFCQKFLASYERIKK